MKMKCNLRRLVPVSWIPVLALGMFCSSSQADPVEPGRLLASNCFQCHGLKDSSPGFGKLVGRKADVLYQAMKDYQADPSIQIMPVHARGYTDEQLRALTEWLSAYRP